VGRRLTAAVAALSVGEAGSASHFFASQTPASRLSIAGRDGWRQRGLSRRPTAITLLLSRALLRTPSSALFWIVRHLPTRPSDTLPTSARILHHFFTPLSSLSNHGPATRRREEEARQRRAVWRRQVNTPHHVPRLPCMSPTASHVVRRWHVVYAARPHPRLRGLPMVRVTNHCLCRCVGAGTRMNGRLVTTG
jgi:hypothetical protein